MSRVHGVSDPSSNAPDSLESAEIFHLEAASPVRALGIAAIAAIAGAVLWVVSAVADLPLALAVLGAAMLIFAVSLALVAVLLARRLRTTVKIEPEQLTVTDGPDHRTVAWGDIYEVTLKGRRLTLGARSDSTLDLVIRNPRPMNDPRFRALVVSVQRHLDADRGYRPLI